MSRRPCSVRSLQEHIRIRIKLHFLLHCYLVHHHGFLNLVRPVISYWRHYCYYHCSDCCHYCSFCLYSCHYSFSVSSSFGNRLFSKISSYVVGMVHVLSPWQFLGSYGHRLHRSQDTTPKSCVNLASTGPMSAFHANQSIHLCMLWGVQKRLGNTWVIVLIISITHRFHERIILDKSIQTVRQRFIRPHFLYSRDNKANVPSRTTWIQKSEWTRSGRSAYRTSSAPNCNPEWTR
mmetsp:Transcript_54540/g.132418  ORF Transcript_54540/g.132418 Transcript_54540/m.132418 type:complete len:234 (-) Transcript_54540:100-801(-)